MPYSSQHAHSDPGRGGKGEAVACHVPVKSGLWGQNVYVENPVLLYTFWVTMVKFMNLSNVSVLSSAKSRPYSANNTWLLLGLSVCTEETYYNYTRDLYFLATIEMQTVFCITKLPWQMYFVRHLDSRDYCSVPGKSPLTSGMSVALASYFYLLPRYILYT